MEDLQPQHIEALSAHLEGLEAALEAFGSDESASASLRRLARSVAMAAEVAGANRLAARAHDVFEAGEPAVERSARKLLAEIRALRPPPSDRPAHVLIVEDNRTVATAVRAYLEAPERTVHVAETAAAAEELLGGHPIDAIVLDLILPDRDGRDLLLQLREQPETAGIPVIVLSAKGGTVARAECLAVGASEFLEKPADPKQLRDAVSRHVAERRRGVGGGRDRDTGLLSRAGILEVHGGHSAATDSAVAILAINELDAVRESFGRKSADDLLRIVASEVRSALGEEDSIGLWSTSELVAVLPKRSLKETKTILRQALGRLAESDQLSAWQAQGIDVSFSAGVVDGAAGSSLRDAVMAAEQSMHRARREGRGVPLGAQEAAPQRPLRILLVEDDRVTATLVHHRLVREGFEVMDFLNGEDAFQWASSSEFDLAILDVKVPGMDGFELLERLRAIERLAAVPIVMLTGLGSEADVIRGLELGASDYMLKPFSPTELLARIRRLFHAPGATTGNRPPSSERPAGAGAR